MVHASTGVALQARRPEASDTPSTRSDGLPTRQVDVDRRVEVAVVVRPTLWTTPLPQRNIPARTETGEESLRRHTSEREKNKEAWARKTRLRGEYRRFYIAMKAEMVPGETLEIGSGMGNIKRWIPNATTSERDPSPDVDRQESAYLLSYPDGSLSNILAMDVWHHLEFPERALAEWRRCLRPGGRVILMEPGMGLLGQLVYGLLHPEPVGWKLPFKNGDQWSEDK